MEEQRVPPVTISAFETEARDRMALDQEELEITLLTKPQHIHDGSPWLSKTRWEVRLAGSHPDDLDLLQVARPPRKDSTDPTEHALRMI
jgi:hypothetical protein